jgi:hypothetical protein
MGSLRRWAAGGAFRQDMAFLTGAGVLPARGALCGGANLSVQYTAVYATGPRNANQRCQMDGGHVLLRPNDDALHSRRRHEVRRNDKGT